ncbi:(2Fe-2S)-binding protein, partial [Lactobacillus crispatus]|uniref:hypothetical protein n=1 Tax=Lactobacillus crispatus TaxID=47770 RepID=UPI0010E7D954
MAKTDDPVALNDWYAVEALSDLTAEPRRTRLLGQDIVLRRQGDGTPLVQEIDVSGRLGAALPVRERYGCLWTTLGAPSREIFEIPEAVES